MHTPIDTPHCHEGNSQESLSHASAAAAAKKRNARSSVRFVLPFPIHALVVLIPHRKALKMSRVSEWRVAKQKPLRSFLDAISGGCRDGRTDADGRSDDGCPLNSRFLTSAPAFLFLRPHLSVRPAMSLASRSFRTERGVLSVARFCYVFPWVARACLGSR